MAARVVLLSIPRCHVVFLQNTELEYTRTSVAVVSLKVTEVPSSGLTGASVALSVGSSDQDSAEPAPDNFHYPIPASVQVCVANDRCVTLPVPRDSVGDSSGEQVCDFYGLIFEDSVVGVVQLESLLSSRGVIVHRKSAKTDQHWAAYAVEVAGGVVASGIDSGAGALARCIRQSGQVVKSRARKAETETEVWPTARTGLKKARILTDGAVDLCESWMGSIANAAAHCGASLAKTAEGRSGAGVTKQVGASSIRSGVTVCHALMAAADTLVEEACGTSADVVSHKYGDEAGIAASDGMHVVGNVLKLNEYTTGKKLVKKFAVGTAKEVGKVAKSAMDDSGQVTVLPDDAKLSAALEKSTDPDEREPLPASQTGASCFSEVELASFPTP